ncbi:hypothetical protein [Rhodococcoides fascians]|uniref:hypothetical protein n=1 Tax=Rhodococcoides fascians TaxID=1828 RepID=UPI00379CAD50
MSACEACWSEACSAAFRDGGSPADHYDEILAKNQDTHLREIWLNAEAAAARREAGR